MKLGNRVTEKDIRDWFDESGFAGRSARFDELELHAIVRPGWVQLFRFTATVRKNDDDNSSSVYGVALCDERQGKLGTTNVTLFDNRESQSDQLEQASKGMILCQQGQNGGAIWLVVLLFMIIVLIAIANWVAGLFA